MRDASRPVELSRLGSARKAKLFSVRPRRRQKTPSACVYPTLRQTWPRAIPEAAMCVRKISAQCVLQFTPSLAAGCVLHRPVSRVIHCSELCFCFKRIRDLSRKLESFDMSHTRSNLSPEGEAFEVLRCSRFLSLLSKATETSKLGIENVGILRRRRHSRPPLFEPSTRVCTPCARFGRGKGTSPTPEIAFE